MIPAISKPVVSITSMHALQWPPPPINTILFFSFSFNISHCLEYLPPALPTIQNCSNHHVSNFHTLSICSSIAKEGVSSPFVHLFLLKKILFPLYLLE